MKDDLYDATMNNQAFNSKWQRKLNMENDNEKNYIWNAKG